MRSDWICNHVIDVRFKTSVERSERVLEVSEAFGLDLKDKEFVIYDDLKIKTEAGQRVYVTGQSGSGKSLILREFEKDYIEMGKKVSNINDVVLKEKPIVELIGNTTNEAVSLLQMAGIGDAYLLLRKPSQLSDGQKYRLKIALLLEQDADVWICDEFGAVLDRKTAKLLAFTLWKMSEKRNVTAVIATTHKDLVLDFGTQLLIDKSYAHEIEIQKFNSEWYETY
jgi:ABC-type ATPase with predicted acetyltransferase domain